MTTARNRLIDLLRRDARLQSTAGDAYPQLKSEWTMVASVNELFEPNAVKDDQLRMMFSCCNPGISQQGQVSLILSLLCGFTCEEIASAFLSSRAATEKRIARAKKALATSGRLFDLSDGDLGRRLCAVQQAVYLMFNEGYQSASSGSVVRPELCAEALRLTRLLTEHPLTCTPASEALYALMCLHAARLPGRVDAMGHFAPLSDQNRAQWDRNLIAQGERYLERSARGSQLSEYHVEAAIAYIHVTAPSVSMTNWGAIVHLYDRLMAIRPSPVVALHRAIAIAQYDGPEPALNAIWQIPDAERLAGYPFFFSTLGELELGRGNVSDARAHFQAALQRTKSAAVEQYLRERLAACEREPAPLPTVVTASSSH